MCVPNKPFSRVAGDHTFHPASPRGSAGVAPCRFGYGAFPEQEPVVCLSSNVLIDEDGGPPIDVELLQTLCPTGIPEHEFEFKAQTPIMLIRNLAPRLGLCNGTRLLAIKLSSKRRTLLAQIISGSKRHIGNLVLLPRIKFKVDADKTGFQWVRTQFPVRVSYLMTQEPLVRYQFIAFRGAMATVRRDARPTVFVAGLYNPAWPVRAHWTTKRASLPSEQDTLVSPSEQDKLVSRS